MRWNTKEYQGSSGHWYIDRKRFLILPKKIDGQWRWMEKAVWLCQKQDSGKWKDVKWIN